MPASSGNDAVRALARRRVGPAGLVRAADLPFLLFVLGLGIVVASVVGSGLGTALAPLLPGGTSLPARFVVDHAACPVLLVWPESAPDIATIPPPPHHPSYPGQ